jgi:hypothetical protein
MPISWRRTTERKLKIMKWRGIEHPYPDLWAVKSTRIEQLIQLKRVHRTRALSGTLLLIRLTHHTSSTYPVWSISSTHSSATLYSNRLLLTHKWSKVKRFHSLLTADRDLRQVFKGLGLTMPTSMETICFIRLTSMRFRIIDHLCPRAWRLYNISKMELPSAVLTIWTVKGSASLQVVH